MLEKDIVFGGGTFVAVATPGVKSPLIVQNVLSFWYHLYAHALTASYSVVRWHRTIMVKAIAAQRRKWMAPNLDTGRGPDFRNVPLP